MFRLGLALLWVSAAAAHADNFDPHTVDYVEDPYAPHVTNGSTARLGTMVGFYYGQRQDVLALGVVAAVGQRFGRLTLEAEGDRADARARRPRPTRRSATAERLGVIARFDVIRLGPHGVGPNSLLVDLRRGRRRASRGTTGTGPRWLPQQHRRRVSRVVPDDSTRVEGQVGFGIMLDHRLQEPIGVPASHRLVPRLADGVRAARQPSRRSSAAASRARRRPRCRTTRYVDRSMLFQSSMSVTW